MEINGVWGDWGPDTWSDDTGTTPNNGPQVQGNSVLTNATVTEGADRWSGWLQGIASNVIGYAVQKDALKSGLVPSRAANGQPVYAPASAYQPTAAGGVSMGTLLIVGAVVVGVMLASKG